MNQKTWAAALVTLALAVLAFGCQSGGIGDPCTPEDEYQQYFSGYEVSEVNIESRSFQCETRLCLVNHFQGRVTCPYGQAVAQIGSDGNMAVPPAQEYQLCHIPGTTSANDRIKVPVEKQLVARQPEQAVYCSCRCD